MTPDDVRAAAEQLVEFHDRFAPLFGKEQAQTHACDYLKGLLVCPEPKSIEPIGVVGVIDETAFTKKGRHSAGVARQHNGRLGKEDTCQVGVFLVGVTPGGSALLDHQLFLPESWCAATPEARDRRERAHIPEDLPFRTKPRIAAELVRNVAVTGTVALDWVVADSEYGRAGHFLDELELLERRYVVEVPVTWVFWTADPAGSIPAHSGRGREPTVPRRDAARTAAEVADELPASAWTALRVRVGALGPLVFEFAAVRVWGIRHRKPGPPSWLLIRRSLGTDPELKYYVSNADVDTPLSTLALVACTRCRVEEFFEDCKGYLGMAQYETRSWVGWHHHMTLVGLAHLFVTLARRRLKKSPGADAGSDGAVAGGGVGGAAVAVGSGH